MLQSLGCKHNIGTIMTKKSRTLWIDAGIGDILKPYSTRRDFLQFQDLGNLDLTSFQPQHHKIYANRGHHLSRKSASYRCDEMKHNLILFFNNKLLITFRLSVVLNISVFFMYYDQESFLLPCKLFHLDACPFSNQ